MEARATLHVSVDSVPFGNTGVRIVAGDGTMEITLTPEQARKLADELMRVADEAEKVSL